jgi:TctA family transporter
MSHFLLSVVGFLELFVFFILPFIVSYKLCKKRGRNTTKGLFVTFFTGWLGTAIIWLFLADKRPSAFDASIRNHISSRS